MLKVALRGLFARKLRLGLTALAVALGVTLIAGSYVFTDTINASFDKIFAATNKGTDVALTARRPIKIDQGTRQTLPASLLSQVSAQPGVAAAAGSVTDQATVFDAHGHRFGAGGFPGLVSSVSAVRRFQGSSIKTGRFPQAPGEAALDAGTAEREKVKLGDTIVVQGGAKRAKLRVVGTTQVAGVSSLGGAAFVDAVLPEAQRVLGKTGRFDEIQVAGDPGTTPAELADRLRGAFGREAVVRTGEQQARSQSSEIKASLGFLTTALLAFGGISLFVGAFIIFNTFSITVTQRMREFALLRTLGAKRGQIMRSVLTEGLVLGVVGSAVGLGLGILTAAGLRALFKVVGVDLPSNHTVIASRTIIVALAVGTLVTLASSLSPALRATRVAPVEALREGAVPTIRGMSRKLTALAGFLLVAGVALMCVGLFAGGSSSASLSFVGAGAAATFLGVALISPRLVRPIASAVGLPFERFGGITGRLARENSVRQPGRTAATAAALMIGVALVTFASIFAAGARETVAKAVDQNLSAALVVQSENGFSPFTPDVLRDISRVDGVRAVSPVRFSQAKAHGISGRVTVSGVDAAGFAQLYKVKMTRGGQAALDRLKGRPFAVVSKKFADDHHLRPGATLQLTTPTGAGRSVVIVGELDDKGGLLADLSFDTTYLERAFGEKQDAFGLVGLRPGAGVAQVEGRIKALLHRDYPATKVQTAQQFKDAQAGQVNQLLGLIYALLALAIVVSLVGIVNTLVLSISERTRELGLMRAIGTSRKQVKRMIRVEAVITALIGGVLGLVLGMVLAILFTQPLQDFTLAIPWGTLAVLLVLAGLAGVAAAALPARRAAKLDVLAALAYE
ncbi:MAG: transporter permease [Solirubrobacterales bacterium]|nr:transporter permease [Solirubrobacterales bacterium]